MTALFHSMSALYQARGNGLAARYEALQTSGFANLTSQPSKIVHAALLLLMLEAALRTSFHHQPEAQHPFSSAIHKRAGRLPHLWVMSGKCSASRQAVYFRFPPKAEMSMRSSRTPLCANSDKLHCSKIASYSIKSSASESIDAGIVRPTALAAVRLITNSNLVGCWTGRSAGFSPLSTRST